MFSGLSERRAEHRETEFLQGQQELKRQKRQQMNRELFFIACRTGSRESMNAPRDGILFCFFTGSFFLSPYFVCQSFAFYGSESISVLPFQPALLFSLYSARLYRNAHVSTDGMFSSMSQLFRSWWNAMAQHSGSHECSSTIRTQPPWKPRCFRQSLPCQG